MSRPWSIVLLAFVLALAACAPVGGEPAVRVVDDVTYMPGRAATIHRPAHADRAPVVVALHGCCGDRADLGQLAWRLAEEGLVVVSPSWTGLDDGGGWPRSYAEAACAVAWARTVAPTHGGDPRRVVLVAWSDAALLAGVLALGGAPTAPDCPAADRPTPDAVVALAGHFGLDLDDPARLDGPAGRFLGVEGGHAAGLPTEHLPDERMSPSPGGQATPGAGRMWLVVGSEDPLRGETQAWAAALAAVDLPVAVTEVAGTHLDVISPRTPLGRAAVEVIRTAAGTTADA